MISAGQAAQVPFRNQRPGGCHHKTCGKAADRGPMDAAVANYRTVVAKERARMKLPASEVSRSPVPVRPWATTSQSSDPAKRLCLRGTGGREPNGDAEER